MQHSVFVLLCFVFGLFACKKVHPARPPCEAQYSVIPQDTSFLSTPLVIPTQLIEDKLNRALGQDVVNDTDFDNRKRDGKRDNIKLKITRLGDVQVAWKDNVARYQAPLLVLLEKQIVSQRVLPGSKSLSLKTEFSIRLSFETALDVGQDWKLEPDTKFVSLEWLSEVKALGGLVDIKKMVERRLDREMPQILQRMNETIRATVRLDRSMARVWRNIQKPMIINRKEELVWLKINPIRFEMGTITTEAGNLLVQGRLSATTETLVGNDPVYTIDSTLPPLVKRRALPNHAYVYMLSEIPYTDLNDIIVRKISGMVLNLSDHRVKVANAEVWGCGTELIFHLSLKGSFRGDIYFHGTPRYEPDSQRVVIQNFDFDVRTEEALMASAGWLLHSTFKDQMETALSIPLADQIAKIPEAITRGIERGRVGKKLDLLIEQWDFRPQQIWVRPTNIAALVIVSARARVELEQL